MSGCEPASSLHSAAKLGPARRAYTKIMIMIIITIMISLSWHSGGGRQLAARRLSVWCQFGDGGQRGDARSLAWARAQSPSRSLGLSLGAKQKATQDSRRRLLLYLVFIT